MKFKIDKRYIAALLLESAIGFILSLILVLYFLNIRDKEGFVVITLAVSVTLYIVSFRPRAIVVKDGYVNFHESGRGSQAIKLSDIAKIETRRKVYNTVTLETKSGLRYKLHPADAQDLKIHLK